MHHIWILDWIITIEYWSLSPFLFLMIFLDRDGLNLCTWFCGIFLPFCFLWSFLIEMGSTSVHGLWDLSPFRDVMKLVDDSIFWCWYDFLHSSWARGHSFVDAFDVPWLAHMYAIWFYVHARLLPDWCSTTFFMFLRSSKVHAIFNFWCSFLPH
jgi:hypothetical protein